MRYTLQIKTFPYFDECVEVIVQEGEESSTVKSFTQSCQIRYDRAVSEGAVNPDRGTVCVVKYTNYALDFDGDANSVFTKDVVQMDGGDIITDNWTVIGATNIKELCSVSYPEDVS